MSFLINEAYLPATLTVEPMSDDDFMAFCEEHADLNFEMTAEGELIVMAPTYSLTAARNSSICTELGSWARKDGRGIVCDSSGGYVLPNGARRSPDASWTFKARIAQLETKKRKKFWPLCPDFVIELKSETDRSRTVKLKMREYMENGAQLGWLIDPEKRSIEIYRPGCEVKTLVDVDKIDGEGPVFGFTLDLATVWNPLGD